MTKRVKLNTNEIIQSLGGFRLREDREYILSYEELWVAPSGDLCIKVAGKREHHLALCELSAIRFYS